MDFAGPFEEHVWPFVVDAHTKRPEIKTTTAMQQYYDHYLQGMVILVKLFLTMGLNSLLRSSANAMVLDAPWLFLISQVPIGEQKGSYKL